MIEDSELLRRYIEERDEGAFRILVDRHIQFVYSTARRRLNGDQHAAEDVAQLVFCAAAKQARTLSRGVLFPAWLYRTTRNVSVDFIRTQLQRRRREQEIIAMHEPPSPSISPEKLRPLLDAAIDDLNEKDRDAIVLRFFSQLTLAQVGAAFRVSEDAARMRVDRALVKLQSALTRRGITSTAMALGTALANEALLATPQSVAARVCGAAISGAGAVVPGAALTIGFMSSIKSFMAAVSVLAALYLASFETVHWRIAVGETADAQRAAATMAERARTSEAEAQKAEQALTATRLQLAALRAEQSRRAQEADTAARTAPGPAEKPWDAMAEGTVFMKRHPEVKDAMRNYLRARARFSYGSFLDSLTLTPEQREKLEVYLMRHQGMGASLPGAASDERQLTFALIEQDGREAGATDRWLKETLGPDGMRQLDEYRKKMNAREDAVRVVGARWNSDSPFTPAQAARLATVFVDHGSLIKRQQVYDWEGISAAAATFLSPSQLSAIEALRTQMQFNAMLSRPVVAAPTGGANLTHRP